LLVTDDKISTPTADDYNMSTSLANHSLSTNDCQNNSAMNEELAFSSLRVSRLN